MKKLLSVIVALTLLLCTACGGNSGADNTTGNTTGNAAGEPSIYEQISGLDDEMTVMTVDGNEIPASMYLYWTMSTASNMEYQVQMYNQYYGMYGEVLNEDKTLKWDAEFREGQTVADYVRAQVNDTIAFYATLENMAKANGYTLTEEDLAGIQQTKEDAMEELGGGEEVFDEYLHQLGISEELFDRLSASYYQFQALKQMVMTEGTALYLDNADYDQYGYYADHILLATMDTSTNTAYDQATIDEKRALAEDILLQLQNAPDPVALFAQLADQYSEDPGRKTNPTGYIFTPGTMVAEFEEATDALKPGEFSGIVQSNYGFHIILRRDLAQGLAENPGQKAPLAEEHLSSLIALNIQNGTITYESVIEDFDMGAFYNSYKKIAQEMAAENGDATITEGNDDTTPGTGSTSTAS